MQNNYNETNNFDSSILKHSKYDNNIIYFGYIICIKENQSKFHVNSVSMSCCAAGKHECSNILIAKLISNGNNVTRRPNCH